MLRYCPMETQKKLEGYLKTATDLAREAGVPLFACAAAFQLFQAGISKFPDEDNWTCVKVLEDIAGTEVKW